jgi:23S rRNA pseudouridine1911/1915/1917 synthase
MGDQATSLATKSWKVPAEQAQIRVDSFVRECLPHLSRRKIEEAIRHRLFTVGDRVSTKGDRLAGGDELVFRGSESWLAASPLAVAELEVPIVYEDSALLVVNKPAGMPTHGFSGRDNLTLANFLLARFPKLMNVGKSRWEPGLVHRLDRETSGLVVVAKTQAAFENLTSQFRRRRVEKIYLALVWGIAPAEGVIDIPLAHDTRDKRRMRAITRSGRTKGPAWKAVTRYRRIGRSRGLSLLEVDMETGVMHQIRAHLAATGHPIVADTLYGAGQTENFGLQRHFLHAHRLTVLHPNDGGSLTIEAELPEELADLLARMNF